MQRSLDFFDTLKLKVRSVNVIEIMSLYLVLSQSCLGGVIGTLASPENGSNRTFLLYSLGGAVALGGVAYFHINKVNRKTAKLTSNDSDMVSRIVRKQLSKYFCTIFGALITICIDVYLEPKTRITPSTLLRGMAFGCFVMPTCETLGALCWWRGSSNEVRKNN